MGSEKPADVTEQRRLNEARDAGIPWKKWGPYLSERQWGTVREDYSDDGNAWDYFSHDQSRSRAYRWGEDGLGGICDDKQRLCFALALWNERDPILKERLFGLTNSEGNHGEDVKEYYFYIDSTPTHSYMKYLYKYPQREFPYRDLVETNGGGRARSSNTNFSILGSSTTIAISTCSSNMPRRVPKTYSSASLFTIAGRKRAPSCTADALVSEHVVMGIRRANPRCGGRAGRDPGISPELGDISAVLRRRTGVAVHRKRDKHAAPLGTAKCFCLGQGCISHIHNLRRPERSKPGSSPARKPLPTTTLEVAAGGSRSKSACDSQPACATDPFKSFDSRLQDSDSRRRTNFTSASPPVR